MYTWKLSENETNKCKYLSMYHDLVGSDFISYKTDFRIYPIYPFIIAMLEHKHV